MGKVIKCKFCDKSIADEELYALHIEKKHPEQIFEGMEPRQFVYYLRTGKTHGSCVMCKSDTKWNPKTNKYHRFCENPKCKEEYKEQFKNRMVDKYGKVNLLDDPEQQRKMLAARSISDVYVWSDRVHKFPYTGTYERSFLEFLDAFEFSPEDLMAPSPHTFYYTYEGKKHFYFPDFFIPSLNLEVEIKDGGDNPNMHHKIQDVDKVKEKLKDEVLSSKSIPFNYIKIVNKDNKALLQYLEVAKKYELEGITKKIVMMGEKLC
jgi:hypothetical protein